MAKFTARGNSKVASYETEDRQRRYTLRGDGAILRQYRIDGRLESPTIYRTGCMSVESFTRFCTRNEATNLVAYDFSHPMWKEEAKHVEAH